LVCSAFVRDDTGSAIGRVRAEEDLVKVRVADDAFKIDDGMNLLSQLKIMVVDELIVHAVSEFTAAGWA
jgi:hypothetical protein